MNLKIARYFTKDPARGRRENKRLKDAARIKIKETPEKCYSCGGEMTWCGLCGMYSATCCQEWGSCECS